MAVAIARTANPAGVTADGSFISTYSAVDIGVAANDRLIAVVIGKEVATTTIAGLFMVVDGVSLENSVFVNGTTFANMGAWVFITALPTGTAADILVAWSGAILDSQNNIAVYRITGGALSSSGNNTSTDMDATAPLTSGSVTIPTNGGMLAGAVGATDTVAKTWANLTEDLDIDAGAFRMTTATSITAGAAARTCTGGTNGEDGVLAWAIFQDPMIPDLTMRPMQPK